ncbi:MAG: Lrp/AsnC family transcriptional regulator [bacterium]
MHRYKLDDIDIKILSMLQEGGRTKRNEIAENVKLSIPSVSERLRKLEEFGIIRSYNAVIEPAKVGLQVMAFIFLTVESSKYYPGIIKNAQANDEILECHAITGEGSHLLKVHTETTATLEKLLSRIQAWPGVKNTHTDIVLSSGKETTVLPLKQARKRE